MTRTVWLAALMALATANLPVAAQFGGNGTVSGNGVVTIERQPTQMRMKVVVTAKGSDLKAALAALKDKLDAAKVQLKALGADQASVKSDPAAIAAEAGRNRQLEMMMAQRLRGKRAAKKADTKPPVSVSTTLVASWPLPAAQGEELLIAATALQDKIKAADLAGAKEADNLTPEEQELADELADQGFNPYSGEEEIKPGEPIFLFVAPLTAADREQALAEGFAKAKEKAARLAKAAGAELGALKFLGDQEMSADEEYPGGYSYNSRSYQMMQLMRGSRGDQEDATEAIGVQPAKVSYRLTVTASFDLKGQ